MNKCIRCNKEKRGIHTCTPTKEYRAGIVEGLKLAKNDISKLDATALFTQHSVLMELDSLIEYRIKTYEGRQ